MLTVERALYSLIIICIQHAETCWTVMIVVLMHGLSTKMTIIHVHITLHIDVTQSMGRILSFFSMKVGPQLKFRQQNGMFVQWIKASYISWKKRKSVRVSIVEYLGILNNEWRNPILWMGCGMPEMQYKNTECFINHDTTQKMSIRQQGMEKNNSNDNAITPTTNRLDITEKHNLSQWKIATYRPLPMNRSDKSLKQLTRMEASSSRCMYITGAPFRIY